jgi:hypothetical protein
VNNDCNDPTWPAVPAGDENADGDGFPVCLGDCDDSRSSVYPGAPQLCDGINNDCSDPTWPAVPANEFDGDGDTFLACADCNDADAGVHPGAAEICNGIDDNCDGQIDEDSLGVDSDGDGIPNACDLCTDLDLDGYAYQDGCGSPRDCNDADPAVHPGAAETCDGRDNDCDGAVDGFRVPGPSFSGAATGATDLNRDELPAEAPPGRAGFRRRLVPTRAPSGVYFARVDSGSVRRFDVRCLHSLCTIAFAHGAGRCGLAWSDCSAEGPPILFARFDAGGVPRRAPGGFVHRQATCRLWSGLVTTAVAWEIRCPRTRSFFCRDRSTGGDRSGTTHRLSLTSRHPALAWTGSGFGSPVTRR